ncbi:hypothetical protein [Bifidobacterium aerophilum]|uniref:Uncharacterized protein n=1 Tax=Bifidobacterium aerophilum TaxID=1798155 RepID=A0A6N9Z507_9BIFI|nr:hypothetical protein [Bifidobacterium aerophilum]NEG89233.1 hypothetical protein [Bifidobacterium aerophilum]
MVDMTIGVNADAFGLSTGDVASQFKKWDPTFHARTQRIFRASGACRELGQDRPLSESDERAFHDWFALDCRIRQVTDRDASYDGARFTLTYDDDGMSPYLMMAEMMHENGSIGDRAIRDMREMDITNFASAFGIIGIDESEGRLMLEDLMWEGEYDVAVTASKMAQYARSKHHGMVVGRIAKIRGAWMLYGDPIYESERPVSVYGLRKLHTLRCITETPDFLGLKDMFYDWRDTYGTSRDAS